MSSKRGSLLFGLVVGLAVALLVYRWVSEPVDRTAREREEQVVLQARETLRTRLHLGESPIVDPLLPDRKIGKAYVYPVDEGWEVSGYYQRDGIGRWYPWLMRLNQNQQLLTLKLDAKDADALHTAASDPGITISE